MANEIALNMEFFNENINGSKNINAEYKQTIEKKDHIITGECYLNYLFSNDYMKPFIQKNYEFKDDNKKSYFDKLNIFNYKEIFNDILNKKKKHFVASENELIRRILNIIDSNNEANNNRLKNKYRNRYKYYIKNYNTKFSSYINNINQKNNTNINNITNYNNKMHTSFDQYELPKINMRKTIIKEKTEREKERNSFDDYNNDVFRTTTFIKSNNDNEKNKNFRHQLLYNKKLNFYSPLLKKNLQHIFKGMEANENQSLQKSRYIEDGISRITRKKFNIDSYDFVKNKYKKKIKNNNDRKYYFINLFNNIGKIKSPQEIEKTLFNKDENITFCKLKTNLEKKGIKRIKENIDLSLSLEP